ncbi:MAG: type II toxin-antitoxin system PemK/MazF family toxin [Verrucomicrobiaceae bacterium]|nr:type II toxin-antitoxin system PemK/MazF family toxin [Verrucomicrobiaceae bacterium]
MARFVSGEVVVLPYPFTDFSSTKVRPALVLAALTRGDIILCQITSQPGSHAQAVPVRMTDFMPGGGLPLDSYALPHRVVTAHESCVRRRAGCLQQAKLEEIRERVCAVIRQG